MGSIMNVLAVQLTTQFIMNGIGNRCSDVFRFHVFTVNWFVFDQIHYFNGHYLSQPAIYLSTSVQ